MAATGKFYPMAHDSFAQKKIDADSDTFKVLLFASYTYAATHQYVSDVKGAGTEASGTGYTAGGATLGSVTWTRSGDVYKFDAADVSWTTTGGSLAAAYAVIACTTPGSDATNPVVGYVNLDGSGGTLTSTSGTFQIVWNAGGIFTQTAS